ncbi:TSUP family transporter [Kiloniella laminariae]|uniref:TSUP family transporter n=1 Tax=Kiloniella laminariae TaxID=454162 RepID=UPI00036D3D87|nr:TSUP family transporter [Kiloniella laminariae]
MMDFLTPELIALMFAAGVLAGFVDAIAGGGGLITLPILLSVGLSPVQAIATNKLQGSFGTFAATVNFVRKGHLDIRDWIFPIVMTFIGAASGVLVLRSVDNTFLVNAIPFLLIAVALYFLFQRKLGEEDRHQRINRSVFALIFGAGIGFYDGFFGPGAGSFYTLAFVSLLGFNMIRATAHTKMLNFTSNFASLLFFILGDSLIWSVGLVMAAGQIFGGYLGSNMTMRHGTKIVRPLLVIVSILMTVKLIHANPDHILRQLFDAAVLSFSTVFFS